MKPVGRKFWISALLALGGMLCQHVQAQTISARSPFLPESGSATAVTENTPLELRGVIAIPGGALFGLFDSTKKLGGWVKLKETGREFTVLSHDASRDAITVEYQGRVLTLELKSSKIESMAVLPMASQRPMAGPQMPGVVGAPSVDEAKRLEAVAAEVARRRQQRQAAMQQAPQPPPQQQQMPAPTRR